MTDEALNRTPLFDQHVAAGARMVGFAGYEMPVQYEGIVAEHTHCRTHAGLFDVSHMGQAELVGPDYQTVAEALEALAPTDALNLKPGRQKYTQLLSADGGILDDLMFARPPGDAGNDTIAIVANAARAAADFAHIGKHLPDNVKLVQRPDLALIAIQGPDAEAVMAAHAPELADMAFMEVARAEIGAVPVTVSRSGYTGEDGYEISLPAGDAPSVWKLLSRDDRVKPVGLGARDTLRLEAGLCLYGNDITTTTTPVEAGLTWSISKRRREEGGYAGAAAIARELEYGPLKKRVGLTVGDRVPVRAGAPLYDTPEGGSAIGFVTSGGKVPTTGQPIAVGYVLTPLAVADTGLFAEVRGRRIPVRITRTPFTPARFKR